jgi:N-acetylmuramoyl-L-alanine amidase
LAATQPFRVVIDPGHGGNDLGTVYKSGRNRVAEKDIALQLSKQVAQELRESGISVILTRSDDREIPLKNRTALANRLKADIFLSIHLNSTDLPSKKNTAEGFETYILNNTTDASSRRLAQLENSVLTSVDDEISPQKDVALILKDLRLDKNVGESKRLACALQKKLADFSTRNRATLKHPAKDRGVKQALFHVLLGADMPSALIEAGFLSNPKDRAILIDPLGQRFLSRAIARAVEQYKHDRGTQFAKKSLNSCKVN